MNELFTRRLIDWQRKHGRHHLPWQVEDPYAIWVSEIMLQQTQVATVQEYYPRFIARFPDVASLAQAPENDVLALWSGLGYYSRARNLHHAAWQIVHEFKGKFPQTRQQLETLKGVGRSSAAAIAVFAFRQPETILDGNVRRVLCRVFAQDGDTQNKQFINHLWQLAETLLPENPNDLKPYTQGLMDLGATICTRSKARCPHCPQEDICLANQQERVNELPRKKQANTVKQQTLIWAIVSDTEHKILLEKRPDKGIWGGLFCTPCFNQEQEFKAFCKKLKLNQENAQKLPPIKHRLTHRLLEIQAHYFRLPESQPHFHTLPQALQNGLPKPLRDLLTQLPEFVDLNNEID